jgi:hypothetical protein
VEPAYLESGYRGEFVEDPQDVARYQLTYDELDVEGSPGELPGGSCRRCRDAMQRERDAEAAVPPEQVRSRVRQLGRAARLPQGSGT